mgnify:CR=1 FL=1
MADGYFPTLVSKDKDPNAAADPIWVQLSDGSAALTTVPVSIASTVNVDLQDSFAGLTGGGTEAGVLRVTIANDSTGVLSIDDNGGAITVDASDLDIRNLNLTDDAVKISANTTANSASNPIFVSMSSGVVTGEVHSFYDVATATNNNHDYTVVATMLVKGIECSASGAAKFELFTGPVATLVAKWTGLIPKAGGTISVKFDPAIEVPVTSTGTVRILRTNRESQSQNMYTTIMGIDA